MPNSDFDLVIAGASFAGLVCARIAALRGLRVAVIEKKPDPGARVHTTGILVKEAADEWEVPHRLTRKVHGVRLYSPALKSVDLFAPGYYFLATDTAGILRWLGDEAVRAGAQLFCDTRFEGADYEQGLIRLFGLGWRTRYLVGADGGKSRVAQSFGLGRNRHFLIGAEAEFDGLGGLDPRFLHCFIDSRLAPGYLGWAVPGVRGAQIGLAATLARTRRSKLDPKRFEARLESVFDFSSARISERRSGLIPAGGPVSPISGRQVLLIGDAAGLVSPMTAGGIQLAFHFGRRSAQAIADHLTAGGPDPGVVMAGEYPRMGVKRMMRAALDTAPPNWLIEKTLFTPPALAFAQRVYFHRRAVAGCALALDDLSVPETGAPKQLRP